MTLRIAYFGLPLAAWLLACDGHDVRFAVLAPVDAPGRRRLTRSLGPERILAAKSLGSRLNSRVEAALAREAPDIVVSWFWTRKLPSAWLEQARFGGIGAHPSLLPRHRGPNPYFGAIDAGDRETGVTVHTLSAEYDEGDLLRARSIPIGERDSWQLARALDRPSLALLREVTAAYANGAPPERAPQRPELVSWAPEPSGDALRVNWSWPTERILRRIRALSPVPGLALDIEGLEFIVTRAERAADFPVALEAGEAAVHGQPPTLVLRTGDGAVAVGRAVVEASGSALDQLLGRQQLAEAVRDHLSHRNTGRLS
jgi:methionyl-tRNA formyltransferase